MAKRAGRTRERGHIRQRGGSYQVLMYAGIDPVTGKEVRLSDSTSDPDEAERILDRMRVEVANRKATRTKATLSYAIDECLRGHEVEETTRETYVGYIERTIRPALGKEPVESIGIKTIEDLIADLRRCSKRCRNGEPAVDHRTAAKHECRVVRHRRRPGRPAQGEIHDCVAAECQVVECPPHQCKPMSKSAVLQILAILGIVFDACMRWEWVDSNPVRLARRPRRPTPQPDPPSTAEAARIVNRGWEISPQWGMFVWLVFVTGMRRGEVLALRWSNIDLKDRMLNVDKNWVELTGTSGYEKDTKSHQARPNALDKMTVKLLKEFRRALDEEMKPLDLKVTDDMFIFSYSNKRDRPCNPSGITHKYTNMCKKMGIDSHLHALRHYSATELLRSGVDLRTVAGRLGHGSGGATTLKVYTKFVTESDRDAVDLLSSRVKQPKRTRPASGRGKAS